jgi:(1->4)-alpha-D-glucan 1-alpha-D-glucosylmutase
MKELSREVVEIRPQAEGCGIPGSTYRLQLNQDFTFQDATEIAEYLNQLGITDCYASPIFAAGPGSSHGYDVCDWDMLNPRIGDQSDFDHWSERLRELGMGLVLDIVPNHMGADPANPWWRDVLQNGQNSGFARWFDIDWRPPDSSVQAKVLLPILEDHYWKVLEAGKLQVVMDHGGFELEYHEHRFPLSSRSLRFLQEEIFRLSREQDHQSMTDWNLLKDELAKFVTSRADCEDRGQPGRRILSRALKSFNGIPGQVESYDSLHALLEMQHYRLAYWRLGKDELNYRRFFDVTGLVALRMELPEVFQATHARVLQLVRQGKITGLRIDHPDGLWNPKQYFVRLQKAISTPPTIANQIEYNDRSQVSHESTEETASRFYVVAEKILSEGESLPLDWPIAGTTGYDFLKLVNGLFVNRSHCAALHDLYLEFTGVRQEFNSLVYSAKSKILENNMRNDLRSLSHLLRSVATQTRYGMDFSPSELRTALSSIVAAFPVYRTYVTEDSAALVPQEEESIKQAICAAREVNPELDPEAFAFIESLLLLRTPPDLNEAGFQASRRFVMRFQQLTGPVMAKGLEDTAFYNFNRLISLNEVGGAPETFGTDLNTFHQQNRIRSENWPHNLLATATHDTKRGEDLRARLNVLSEIPEEWGEAVLKWKRLNADKKVSVNGQPAPNANDEYFLYQALVGAWCNEAETAAGSSIFCQRISEYMLKAIREAKAYTSWMKPNVDYEQATQDFIKKVLYHSDPNPFLDDFMLFHRKIAIFGLFNSLVQVVLKMTAPGVPDFYQGTELWDFSLVDPDNRRPIDYQTRKALLSELRHKLDANDIDFLGVVKGLLKNHQNGQIKMYLIWRILEFRRSHRALFDEGEYLPLLAQGPKQDHICAFIRTNGEESAITVAARLVSSLTQGAGRGALEPDVWQDTVLPVRGERPGAQYRNLLTQQVVTFSPKAGGLLAREVLTILPVAVLERLN